MTYIRRQIDRLTSGAAGSAGQNLLEFALLTPIVLIFLAGIVMFGFAMNARASAQQAVREGARQAAVGKSLSEVQNLAAGNAPDYLDPSDIQWCFPSGSTGDVGDSITVYIYKDGAEGLPFTIVPVGGVFAGWGISSLTVRMSPRATARLEQPLPVGAVVPNC